MAGLRRGARRRSARPSRVIGLGYSNGANILASVIFARPALFDAAVLMHPLIPWTPEPAPVTTRVLITAGERDPICPPEETRALEAWFAGAGRGGRQPLAPGRPRDRPLRNRCHRAVPALDGERRQGGQHGDRAERHQPRGRPRARAATSTAPAGDEAEMTFSKAGERPRHHRPHRGAAGLPRPGRRAGAGRARRSPTPAPRARRSLPLCPFAAAQFRRHPGVGRRAARREGAEA